MQEVNLDNNRLYFRSKLIWICDAMLCLVGWEASTTPIDLEVQHEFVGLVGVPPDIAILNAIKANKLSEFPLSK